MEKQREELDFIEEEKEIFFMNGIDPERLSIDFTSFVTYV